MAANCAHGQVTAVDVLRIAVEGNTLLSAEQQAAALGPLPARMALPDMQAAAQRLQTAYRDAGFGAVVVVVPEQVLDTTTLRLTVVEGRLRHMTVTGQRQFSRDNIVRSLPSLQAGLTPSLADLDRELLLVNQNPAKSARVVLQPGDRLGDVDGLVVIEEQPVERWTVGLDNTGVPGTGRYRTSLAYQHANVGDRDAVLGVRAATSPTHPSHVAVVGATLRVPLYGYKTAIEGNLLASNTRSATNSTPAGDLRFSGSGASAGARAVWLLPSLSEVKTQVALGVDARTYKSECSLGIFGAAGCGNAAGTVHVLPVTLSLAAQKLGTLAAGVQAVANLPVGAAGRDSDFAANRPGARAGYQVLRANANALQALGPQWQLAWRADAQWAPRAVVAAEQFGAAGMYTVRGYEERAVSADSGAVGSLEVRTRLDTFLPVSMAGATPLLAAFADAGRAHNHLGTACMPGRDSCTLWSAGVGVVLTAGRGGQLRLDLARAGTPVQATQRGDWKAHLSFSYSL